MPLFIFPVEKSTAAAISETSFQEAACKTRLNMLIWWVGGPFLKSSSRLAKGKQIEKGQCTRSRLTDETDTTLMRSNDVTGNHRAIQLLRYFLTFPFEAAYPTVQSEVSSQCLFALYGSIVDAMVRFLLKKTNCATHSKCWKKKKLKLALLAQ